MKYSVSLSTEYYAVLMRPELKSLQVFHKFGAFQSWLFTEHFCFFMQAGDSDGILNCILLLFLPPPPLPHNYYYKLLGSIIKRRKIRGWFAPHKTKRLCCPLIIFSKGLKDEEEEEEEGGVVGEVKEWRRQVYIFLSAPPLPLTSMHLVCVWPGSYLQSDWVTSGAGEFLMMTAGRLLRMHNDEGCGWH